MIKFLKSPILKTKPSVLVAVPMSVLINSIKSISSTLLDVPTTSLTSFAFEPS